VLNFFFTPHQISPLSHQKFPKNMLCEKRGDRWYEKILEIFMDFWNKNFARYQISPSSHQKLLQNIFQKKMVI